MAHNTRTTLVLPEPKIHNNLLGSCFIVQAQMNVDIHPVGDFMIYSTHTHIDFWKLKPLFHYIIDKNILNDYLNTHKSLISAVAYHSPVSAINLY